MIRTVKNQSNLIDNLFTVGLPLTIVPSVNQLVDLTPVYCKEA